MYSEQNNNGGEKHYADGHGNYTNASPPYDANSYHHHQQQQHVVGAGSPPPPHQPHLQSTGSPDHFQSSPPPPPQNFQPPQQAHTAVAPASSYPEAIAYEQKQQSNIHMAQMNAPQPYAPQASSTGRFQTAIPIATVSMTPAPIDCPNCKQRALTRTEKHVGNTTHAWGFITCCLTGCLCFIPYLMDSLKDVDHFCGNCNAHVAKWHKSGNVEVLIHA